MRPDERARLLALREHLLALDPATLPPVVQDVADLLTALQTVEGHQAAGRLSPEQYEDLRSDLHTWGSRLWRALIDQPPT